MGGSRQGTGFPPRPVFFLMIGCLIGFDLFIWGGQERLRWGGHAPLVLVVMSTAVAYSTLVFARSAPLTVFVAQIAFCCAVSVFLPDFQPFSALLVALWSMGRRVDSRRALWSLSACLCLFVYYGWFSSGYLDSRTLPTFLVASMLWCALAGGVWGMARLIRQNELRAEREKELRAAEVVATERLRLARELHDIVSHTVSVMLVQAAGAKAILPDDLPKVERALDVIEDSGVQAMAELRRLLVVLRSSQDANPDDGASGPGLKQLDTLVQRARGAGIEVALHVDGPDCQLSRSVDLAAYRVIQEALTNTIRYAGHGASTTVHLVWSDENLTIDVRDRQGERVPSPALSSGLGLIGLSERVALLGGTLERGPVAGGFAVTVKFPLIKETSARHAS